jgi:sugar phosphate isomerase/epimerase
MAEHADPQGRASTAPAPVLISLSAFGATDVARLGQAWFAGLASAAGADGVEVRGELLRGSTEAERNHDLDAVASVAAAGRLARVYSSPEGLWNTDGQLDLPALERALAAAGRLDARRVKMSIGGFGTGSAATLTVLRDRLAAAAAELLIENDQTPAAGTLPALVRFFAAADAARLPLGMTFDIGNWHWLGESPLQAAETLRTRVRYVHLKGVQRQPQRWVAVPLADSAAPWRAVLRALPPALPRAIEYPLAGDDLVAVTQAQVRAVRALDEGVT